MPLPEDVPAAEFGETQSSEFGFLYGLVCARLEEAFYLQANPRYSHVGYDTYSGISGNYVSIRLAATLDDTAESKGNYFDIGIPVTSITYDEHGYIIDADIVEGDAANFVISTDKRDPDSAVLVSPQNAESLEGIIPSNLADLPMKFLGYDVAPLQVKLSAA